MILANVWLRNVSLKIYELVLLNNILVQHFEVRLALSFWFFLEGYLLPLIFKLIQN